MTPRATLTAGPVASTLIRLTGPMLVAMLGMVGFNIADTYFIGQLGTEPLAAISFTFPVVFVIGSVSMGLSVGAGAVISRAIGRGDQNRVRRLTSDALMLSLAIVLAVVSVGISTVDPLFSALGAKPHLLRLITEYMSIWYLGMPFVVIPMVGNGAIRATGDTRTPATIMLVATAANIALDPLLIFGMGPIPGMGLRGAAFATVGARAITLVAALYILSCREHMLSFKHPPLAEAMASWRAVLYIGVPAALTQLITPASIALVTRLVASFGVAAVAGFGVATRLEMLPIMFINALSSVLMPFIGQNWGAGKMDRVRSAVRFSHGVALGVGAVAVLIFWFVGDAVARLFNDDPEVVETVVHYGRVVGIGWGLQGVIALSSSAFNALNRPLRSTTLSLLRMVVLYVPLAWVFSHWFGLMGIFVAALVANIAAGGVAFWWIRFEDWRDGQSSAPATTLPLDSASASGSDFSRQVLRDRNDTVAIASKRANLNCRCNPIQPLQKPGGEGQIHPHRLRHTFGVEMREKTGSDTEPAALLGHAGLKYVGRYVRNTQTEREAILESVKVEGE